MSFWCFFVFIKTPNNAVIRCHKCQLYSQSLFWLMTRTRSTMVNESLWCYSNFWGFCHRQTFMKISRDWGSLLDCLLIQRKPGGSFPLNPFNVKKWIKQCGCRRIMASQMAKMIASVLLFGIYQIIVRKQRCIISVIAYCYDISICHGPKEW